MISTQSPSSASRMQRNIDDEDDDEEEEYNGGGERVKIKSHTFACCYLVASLSEQHKGKTYVGFTVNPKRRLLQHNGQYANAGAKYTKKLRPCEMVFCVHGFPSKTQALGFEWAWQNPTTSRAVKEVAQNQLRIGSRHTTILNKSLLGLAMMSLSPWKHLPLVVHFFDESHKREVLKNAEKKDVTIPSHVRIEVGEMSKLDAYVKTCNISKPFKKKRRTENDDGDDLLEESEDFLHDSDELVCEVCLRKSKNIENGGDRNSVDDEGGEEVCCTCLDCGAHAHLVCLAKSFFERSRGLLLCDDKENYHCKGETSSDALIPEKGKCPRCDRMQTWGDVLASRARAAKKL
jgi:structure-specific endonuclease subunit SLX1